ncbi:MAG: hypothetical protein ACK4UT_04430, partial [Moraxellaceae bacterium]
AHRTPTETDVPPCPVPCPPPCSSPPACCCRQCVALAERVIDTGNRWLKLKVRQRCADDPAYAKITKSRALQNNYFVNDLVFDGENCVQPAGCDTWACPRQGVPEE